MVCADIPTGTGAYYSLPVREGLGFVRGMKQDKSTGVCRCDWVSVSKRGKKGKRMSARPKAQQSGHK